MKLDKERKLFFGYKIDSKLREALANAKPGDRHYFEDPESEYLRICSVEEERWIGKVIKCGLGVNDVEDVQRNVISILRRVAPNMRHSPTNVKIFSVADDTGEPLTVESLNPRSDRSDGGPYID